MAISMAVKSVNTMHHDSMSVNFVRFGHTFPLPHDATWGNTQYLSGGVNYAEEADAEDQTWLEDLLNRINNKEYIEINMTKHEVPKLFEDRKIRKVWDDKEEKWYFSIVDVVGVLTDQPDIEHARNYWKVLKHRLKKEGNKSVTNCNQLKLRSSDGKSYKTDLKSRGLIKS